jgi:hypothetical protein
VGTWRTTGGEVNFSRAIFEPVDSPSGEATRRAGGRLAGRGGVALSGGAFGGKHARGENENKTFEPVDSGVGDGEKKKTKKKKESSRGRRLGGVPRGGDVWGGYGRQ